jgi:hypothetical protein
MMQNGGPGFLDHFIQNFCHRTQNACRTFFCVVDLQLGADYQYADR